MEQCGNPVVNGPSLFFERRSHHVGVPLGRLNRCYEQQVVDITIHIERAAPRGIKFYRHAHMHRQQIDVADVQRHEALDA